MPETETTSATTPSTEWLHDFMQRWRDAWNSHEIDGVLALMTEDVEARDDSWLKVMRGHAEVREFLEATWRAMPDMAFEMLSGPYVIPGEPCAAFHWHGGATSRARSSRPASRLPGAAGRSTAATFTSFATAGCARCEPHTTY